MDFTKWTPTGFGELVDKEFHHTVYSSQERNTMKAWYILEGYPHMMFTIAHSFKGREEYLLRGELLAITAAMITRLRSGYLPEHTIIPVGNLISSLSLQAFMCVLFPITYAYYL
ncbi:hypothetical protein DTO212C5_1051 [Paecilomyces variotii]|nr:hypothetical protein DTO212C5_1051 [Paecilomyces variotii]